MTKEEYRAALSALGLTQSRAGKLFGKPGATGAGVNGRKWATGKNPVPTPVAILLRLMRAGRISVKDIEEMGR